MASKKYDASQIKVLKGLEPVRQNPGLWIGDSGSKGYHHMLWEAIDNSVDEHLAGFGNIIRVVLHKNGSATVEDRGRGIPIDEHPDEKRPAAEVVLTTLHAGGKFDREKAYQVSGGLHGVGISVVNALSSWLKLQVKRDGYEWRQNYKMGMPQEELQKGKSIGPRTSGTSITFLPDPDIFGKSEFDVEIVKRRLREITYLLPDLKITLEDERTGEQEHLHNPGGICDYVVHTNEAKDGVYPSKPVTFDATADDGSHIEVAWQYSDQQGETLASFANVIPTTEHGNHVTGFRAGWTRAINGWARTKNILKDKDDNLTGDDLRDGMTAIIAVKLVHPIFEGQTKTRLGNPDIEAFASQVTSDAMTDYLQKNPDIGRKVVSQAIQAREARERAKAAAAAVRKKRPIEALPDKLADCSSRKREERELFICEGNSAAGSAKQARDPRTQAVLPVRGKVRNVEKVTLATGLKNAEVQDIIAAIGTGIIHGKTESMFDLDALRYERIIIMTDADVDGQHIQTLLLTLFFRYMRPLIEEGFIYIARPPLYRIDVSGGRREYAHDENALAELQKKYGKARVSRFKGLGEMTAKELGATAMNPATRDVVKVEIGNAAEADHLFSALMGTKVGPRRDYIEKHEAQVIEQTSEMV